VYDTTWHCVRSCSYIAWLDEGVVWVLLAAGVVAAGVLVVAAGVVAAGVFGATGVVGVLLPPPPPPQAVRTAETATARLRDSLLPNACCLPMMAPLKTGGSCNGEQTNMPRFSDIWHFSARRIGGRNQPTSA